MRFTVDPTSANPIYAQLVEQVKHAVASGTLKPFDPLPSLRDVSLHLRISPLTVKRAYGELETLGIITTEHGRGSYISSESATFSTAYRNEALAQAVDRLLIEAHHLGASLEEVTQLLQQRRQALTAEREPQITPITQIIE